MTIPPDSNDRQIVIGTSDINDPDYQTKYEDDINFIQDNLILRLLLNFLGLCSSSMGKIFRFFKKLNLVFFINKYF